MMPVIPGITSLEAAMMGRQTGDQASLFYEFRLEDRISKDHLLRRINVFVAPVLDSVREQLKPYYSEIGRPSVGAYAYRYRHRLDEVCVSDRQSFRFLCRCR